MRTASVRVAVLAIAGVTVLSPLTACAGSSPRPPTAPAPSVSSVEGAGAPMPQDAPGQPPTAKLPGGGWESSQ
ncbi:hypothetical protein [Mycolicibacterium gadium]|uniref:hypothetical protein n=1 Tax=Mycolicibacterium gadium TaxID=1794 RepID=UPI0021F30EAF|nr:hypothetical protein [Mycolicibacterium gadium]